jgi:hypothetical protein
MLLRVTNSHGFLLLAIVLLVIYPFILQLYFSFDDKPIVEEEISIPLLILPNSSMYNEFIQIQFPFLRLIMKDFYKIINHREDYFI